jgi:hypothetical protein
MRIFFEFFETNFFFIQKKIILKNYEKFEKGQRLVATLDTYDFSRGRQDLFIFDLK